MPRRGSAVSPLTGAALRLVVTCEHGGPAVPSRYAPLFRGATRVLASHRAFDAGALDVARILSRRLGAPLVYSKVSRLLVDLNRSEHHPRLFSEWTRRLPRADREDILDRHYLPHRRAVDVELERAMGAKGSVLHVAVHSFTPVWDGIERPMALGLLYDPARAPERRLCRTWQLELSDLAPDLVIRRNAPYRGANDGLTRTLRLRHAPARYLGVEVELNQATLRTPAAKRRWAALLAESIERALWPIGYS